MACWAADDLSPARSVAALVAATLLLALLPGVAHGHGGIVPQPVIEVEPELEGLEASAAVTVAPQLVVRNTSDTPVTFLDDEGRPWLRISADGVEADLTAPRWWLANDPRGVGQDPPPDAPEGWTRVAADPSFGWFPPALRPPTSAEQDHAWSVPVLVGDEPAEFAGTLEEVELAGAWATQVQGDGDLGGAQLAAVSGTVPALVVQRRDAGEVVVLGVEQEPMLRLGAQGLEANRLSPTWHQHTRWDTGTSTPTVDPDASAEPDWELLTPRATTATWLEPRGATGRIVPASNDEADRRLPFEVTLLVDGDPVGVELLTRWEGQDLPGGLPTWAVPGGAVLLAALLAAAAVWRRRAQVEGAT